MSRYDHYTDKFIDGEPITINSSPPQFRVVQLVELTDECVEKIADAVARRLLGNEDTEDNWYDWRDENGEIL